MLCQPLGDLRGGDHFGESPGLFAQIPDEAGLLKIAEGNGGVGVQVGLEGFGDFFGSREGFDMGKNEEGDGREGGCRGNGGSAKEF